MCADLRRMTSGEIENLTRSADAGKSGRLVRDHRDTDE
jgi:hypothetical protein